MEENQVSENTEETTEEVKTVDSVTSETSERPEWLPEKFNDPADLGKAYKALESKLGEKEDDVRNRLMEELNEQASEGVPASAGEYELPDFLDEEEALESFRREFDESLRNAWKISLDWWFHMMNQMRTSRAS